MRLITIEVRDKVLAWSYLTGKITRADVNRAYGLDQHSKIGMYRIARACREMTKDGELAFRLKGDLRAGTQGV